MQAIGDIISYFFPYYFNCHAKKCTKIQLGENIWYFFSQCLYFFPLRPCNNFSTVYWGENNARGKSNHIFPAEHNLFLWQFLSWVFQLGENIWYFFPLSLFFPLCLYFFLIRPCNNCSTFRDSVIGGKYGKREIKSYNVS